MIKIDDQVACVGGEFSTCPLHNEERLGPDPHPEMVGKVYVVESTANWAKQPECSGLIRLRGLNNLWCVGCFRKIEKADESFIESLLHRLRSESELV